MSPPPVDRRLVLAGALAATALAAGGRRAAAAVSYDAVVARPGQPAPPGPRFATLAGALAAAPPGRPFALWIGRGVWTEKLTVTLADLHLTGEERAATRLVFAAAAGDPGPDGKPWGTFGSATLTVLAPGFRATNLTIENAFDPGLRAAPLPSDRPQGQQAVALMLAGASDDAQLDRVDILGRQDTVLTNGGRTHFRDCLIAGTVDFIFGAGMARFERCEIRSRTRADDGAPQGYVAAPSTPASQPLGLIFDRCRLTRDPGLPDRSVFLARPWRPTRRFADGSYGDPQALGMASFTRCWMDAHIARERWTSMTYSTPTGQRVPLLPETVRFSESGTVGPGA